MWLLNLDKWCAPGFCSCFMCLVLVAGVMGLKCEVSWENNEIAILKNTRRGRNSTKEVFSRLRLSMCIREICLPRKNKTFDSTFVKRAFQRRTNFTLLSPLTLIFTNMCRVTALMKYGSVL